MFRKLILLSAIMAFVVILSGAYERLIASGIGCFDWPQCYTGQLSRPHNDALNWLQQILAGAAETELSVEKLAYYGGQLCLVGFALFLLLFSGTQKHCRAGALTGSFVVLVLSVLQASTAHWAAPLSQLPQAQSLSFMINLLVFWSVSRLYLRTHPALVIRQTPNIGLRVVSSLAMVLVLIQILLGSFVTSLGAALACPDFPLCQGQWWPDNADFSAVINIFQGQWPKQVDFAMQIAFNWSHRVGALILFVVLTAVMWLATKPDNAKTLRRWGLLLSVLLVVQLIVGILIVKLALPLTLTIAHSGLAALLMLPLVAIRLYSWFEKSTSEAVVPREAAPAPEKLEPVVETIEPEPVLQRLKKQLQKTRSGLGGVLTTLSGSKIDEDLLEEIEASLLMADVGIEVTQEILQHLRDNLDKQQLDQPDALVQALKQHLYEILEPVSQPLVIPEQDTPFVILVVGVNGAGKTTSIGKLAKRLQNQGHSVMLAAGDTFRAAAVEQLETWGERNNIPVIAQHTGADSASVIFDAVQSAQAKGIDVLIADTAGRLHTKSNLMEELSKIKRIMARLDENAPHEVLLVLDAGTGQNALSQAKLFNEAVQLTGIALTKLDGTAKGGVIFALARKIGVPIRFIGVGEGIDDLQDFDARLFVDALFEQD
jgi:fused signal recognition particle receptor